MVQEIFKRTLASLIAYRRRSMMTILGVAWGISSFILLIAYGDGFQRAMNLGLSYFGDNVVVLWNGQTSLQAGGGKAGRVIRTTPSDLEAIRQRATLVKRASPEVFKNMQFRWGDRMASAGVRAVGDQYGAIRGMFLVEGRFLSPEDLANMRRVVVLGYDLKEKLFSRSPALG
jgi:putative ABC transport system permease protein